MITRFIKRQYKSHVFFAWLFILTVCLLITISATTDIAQAATVNTNEHTKQQVIDRLKNNYSSVNEMHSFSVQPQQYDIAGELSEESKESALKMLNNIRYVAGLDDVELSDDLGKTAQAAAFVNWCIGKMTHYPADVSTKPDGMPDEIWDLGVLGDRKSNLYLNPKTLNAAVLGWTRDEDYKNLPMVGHRRWSIYPKMGKVGFGVAGPHYAQYSFDSTNIKAKYTNVAWPARIMPVQFFKNNVPWSLSVGDVISTGAKVSIKLTRRETSPSGAGSWGFSETESYTATDTGKYFNVDNDPYGQTGCIIFRPDNIEYKPGDIFDVTINGVKTISETTDETIQYSVEFIDGYPAETISFEKDVYIFQSSTGTIKPQITPVESQGYEVDYSSSDESVATVSSDGKITRTGYGKTTITAAIDGKYTASGKKLTAQYSLKVPKEIHHKDIKVNVIDPEYTGSVVRPKVEIIDEGIKKTLIEGEDYSLQYKNDITEPFDFETVYIIGLGDYYDETARVYSVQPKKITKSMITVDTDSFEYNGKVQKPVITVMNGDIKLKEGTDYSLDVPDSKAVGKYTVIIEATSDCYTGSETYTYSIKRKTITDDMISDMDEMTYTGSPITPNPVIKHGIQTLKKGTDYTLAYSGNTNAGDEAKVIVKGKGNYDGQCEKPFSIARADINNAAVSFKENTIKINGKTGFLETGSAIEPKLSIKFNGKEVSEENYDVSYENNVASGLDAKIIVTGKNNLKGTKKVGFVIFTKAEYDEAQKRASEEAEKARKNQRGKDGTVFGNGASAEAAEAAILSMKSDIDPAGTSFSKLQLKAVKVTKNTVKAQWKKVAGANKYVIYANMCGPANRMSRLTSTSGTSYSITKAAGKALKKGTYYKLMVVALNAKNNVVSSSPIMHATTAGGKTGNHKAITIKAKIGKKTKKIKTAKIKVKKTLKLKAKAIPAKKKLKVKKHTAVRFDSSDPKVASVSKTGVVKGHTRGKCSIYAYAQNGVCSTVKLTVK